MTLMIYNSLTKQKEIFKPIVPGSVSLYACGITVYDYCHIGHARASLVFDMVTRYLSARGYKVTYAQNITDVDDKIIRRAAEQNETCEALTSRFIQALREDEQALGILPPNHTPLATAYIPQMIQLIKRIIQQGYGYVADNGDVCFAVRDFKNYGQLSHRKLDDLRAGARITIEEGKRDPLDFVLWKVAKPGEPAWPSPWGEGRPGWHIECSAMSTELLGQPFDIHGGGLDLKFPHHENEIAQAQAASNRQFAHYWMHVGLLQVNNEKMSKSLGNFVTIRDMLQQYHAEVLRYFMLSVHYRSPINYSPANMAQARAALARLYNALRDVPVSEGKQQGMSGHGLSVECESLVEQFYSMMDDDFNSPSALAILFDMAHIINRWKEVGDLDNAKALATLMKQFGHVFGILQQDPVLYLQGDLDESTRESIDALIDERKLARQNQNWKQADAIRAQLLKLGVAIEDTPDGTIWKKV